ncbi:MAG: glycosyltransferase family 1 protein [Patescibacteria group bacterium]
MTIAIDASRANRDHKTGTEWYSWHLIQELKKIMPENIQVLLYTNEKLKGELGSCPQNFQEKIISWPPRYLWTQIRLWWQLLVCPPEILFVPAHTIPFLPLRKKIKVVVTVHDVGFKRFPELYKKIQVYYHDLTMKKIKSRADVIITDSDFSKREITNFYGIEPEKIKIVYLGYDQSKYNLQAGALLKDQGKEVLTKYKIVSPYLLYIGRLEKKKNIGNIIKAFALAKLEQEDLKLVLVGNAGNQYEEIKKIITDLRLEQEIIMPGYLAAEDLPLVIAGAKMFLFPTLYEGFGLPILEAMACGTPVITSDLEPHREVAGAAAIFVDPSSPEDLANKILKVLADSNLRLELISGGLKRITEFSWRKTAQQTLAWLLPKTP